jgi:hypothetical protein
MFQQYAVQGGQYVRDKVGLPSEAVLSVAYLAAVMISVNIQHIRTHIFISDGYVWASYLSSRVRNISCGIGKLRGYS